MDEITRTPFSHSHNLALTGGTTDFNYRASVSYRNNQGIALKAGFNEMIARFSANQNLFDKKIQIAYDATYRRFDRKVRIPAMMIIPLLSMRIIIILRHPYTTRRER